MSTQHPFHILLPQQAVPLRRRALKLTCNPARADDLVQATLLKAWSSRDGFSPETNLRAWLFTILRNTFFSEIRKYRLEVQDVDGAGALSLSEEPRQDHALALGELLAAIAVLPKGQRLPLVMMGAYGYSQQEVAEACGCTVGTVKSRVSRARSTLSRILDHDDLLPVAPGSRVPTGDPPARQSPARGKTGPMSGGPRQVMTARSGPQGAQKPDGLRNETGR